MSFTELAARARGLASGLSQRDEFAGEQPPRVLLALADPIEFAQAFFAVAVAGGVPVPGPDRPASHPGHRRRLEGIVAASAPALVITSAANAGTIRSVCGDDGAIEFGELDGATGVPLRRPADVAYVQYTSGSISAPKPIEISHANVVAQLAQAAEAFDEDGRSVSVNWVPLFHDMGLVTSLLRPLWSGYTSVLLDPMDFIRRPEGWPAAMTHWRATHTSAPDFGYAFCATRTREVASFDLGSLRVARSAGEMVRPATIDRFSRTFGPAGFDPRAFTPSYGLAEATLTVSTCAPGELPHVVHLSREEFRHGRIVADDSADAVGLVTAGRPLRGTVVRVIGPNGEPRADAEIGEMEVSGPQVAGGTVRTGDLGFLFDGEVVLVGRARERFQVHGENFYSGEIESLLGAHEPRIRAGRIAAFLALGTQPETTQFVIVAELRQDAEPTEEERRDIRRHLIRLASEHFGLSAGRVELVPAFTIPLTTSGKVRREACLDLVTATPELTATPGRTATPELTATPEFTGASRRS